MFTVGTSELARSDREVLALIAEGPRDYKADGAAQLRLERRGLIRRLGTARRGRFSSKPAIRWEITPAGLATLQVRQGDDLTRRPPETTARPHPGEGAPSSGHPCAPAQPAGS